MLALIVSAVTGGVAVLAFAISAFQELRHWRENHPEVEVDVREAWTLSDTQDRISFVALDLVAFNPSVRGVTITHLRLEAPAKSEVAFSLGRPKLLQGDEWYLEGVGTLNHARVSGDLNLPYTMPPINLPPRQGERAVVGFLAIKPTSGFTGAQLRLVARLGSRRHQRHGLLWWRKVTGKSLEAFDEVEASWLLPEHAGTRFVGGATADEGT